MSRLVNSNVERKHVAHQKPVLSQVIETDAAEEEDGQEEETAAEGKGV